jgi:hypothetical protein
MILLITNSGIPFAYKPTGSAELAAVPRFHPPPWVLSGAVNTVPVFFE